MRIGLLGLLFVYLLGFMPHAFAFSTGETASLVIGQSNFTSNAVAVTSTGLNGPRALAFDSGGNLWAADESDNRVLEYAAPFSTGETASLVIGQSSFTSNAVAVTSTGFAGPADLAFDSGGNLWAADQYNHRILEYATSSSTSSSSSSSSHTSSSSSSSSSHTSSSSSSSSSHASSSSSSVSTTSPRVGSWIYLGTAAAVVVVIIIVAAYYTTIRGRSKPSATPPP
jgi:hypothetical protein